MRIGVTGKTGQVVTALQAIDQPHEIIPFGRPEVDLAQPERLEGALRALRPDMIFSVAAYTQVDAAESDREMAQIVNAEAPAELARLAQAMGVPIVHLSTDYVFDGDKPSAYVETDETGPLNIYGLTKREGERRVAAATDNHVILRTSWVYSPFGRNFVKTMRALAETRDTVSVVADQRGCPTSALDIARHLIRIAERLVASDAAALRGLFHLTAPDDASWAELAEAVFADVERRTGRKVTVRPIPAADYPVPARRPFNSRLDCGKLWSVYGLRLDPWRQALDEVLEYLYASDDKRPPSARQG